VDQLPRLHEFWFAVIGGYHVAFATGAAPAVVAAALGSMWLPTALHHSKTASAQ
jgi:hypothetical protein